jgi:hypothetical protein
MSSRGWDRDGAQHDTVVSNLMDLQARLRGDPGSLVLPREGRRDRSADTTTVRSGDVSVTVEEMEVEEDPERRIESLRRRLEYLELEIDAYEHAAEEPREAPAPAPVQADVAELQHVVEERLTAEHDGAATGEPAAE